MSTASVKLLSTTIGRKFAMGITGLFLISFLIVHCSVNALIFLNDGGKTFNVVAEFMGTNIIIRTMEIVLFIGIIWHIVEALILTLRNNKARPIKYKAFDGKANSKWYSRWMGLLGTLILMFLIIHLRQFWLETRFIGLGQPTLFDEMKEVFSNSFVVALYVAAMFSLAYHLLHGFQSAFQSLGLNHKTYTPIIKTIGTWFSIIVPLIFAMMPVAIYMNWVK